MSKFLKAAATEELNAIMDGLLDARETTPEQADMLYAIVDELKERGAAEQFTDKENDEFAQKMLAMAQAAQGAATGDGRFFERILRDAENDRRAAKQKTGRRLTAAAVAAMVVLLINTITITASGVNFIGDMFGWTGNAIYSLFDGKPAGLKPSVHMEVQALRSKLDELSISVGLPSAIPASFFYNGVDVLFDEEPYLVIGWFHNIGESTDFSLTVVGNTSSISTRIEVNDNNAVEIVELGGVVYSVFENYDRIVVVWNDGDYEMLLQGDITIEQAITVIESIQR